MTEGSAAKKQRTDDVFISSNFDSGNIKVVDTRAATTGNVTDIDLEINSDPYTGVPDNKAHMQWFHFRASNVRGRTCNFRIVNAGKCSYPEDFASYRVCYSFDRVKWMRAPTTYDEKDGVMSFAIASSEDTLWCAYFAPFSYEEHQQLIARCAHSPLAGVRVIGRTVEGRDLDLVTVGTGTLKAWVTARQHPGESMAEHFADGLLARLLDPDDALARKLRSMFTFHVIPNMNPDGSIHGYLRTNAKGANLNREWCKTLDHEAPTLDYSPEVFYTLQEMDKVGCDFFCDVHGDEGTPHNFFAGSHAMPNWTNRHAKLLQILGESLNKANPDFGNLKYNYGNDEIGGAVLNTAAEQIGHRFNCLSVTLEQPFKDCFDTPEPECGWSAPRCRRLGASILDAIAAVAPDLRREFEVDEASLPAWTKPGYENPEIEALTWEKK